MRTLPFFLFVFLCRALFGASIEGFWKTVDEATGHPRCVLAVYEYDGVYFGRIVGTFSDKGEMNDTIYKPIGRAPGVVGDPYYSGLDILWDLRYAGISYKGKILDPQKGNVYNAELWTEGSNLIVRGKLLIFGRNHTWYPAQPKDFPKGFKMPALNSFVPVIPKVK